MAVEGRTQAQRLLELAVQGDTPAERSLSNLVSDRSNDRRLLPLLCPLALNESTKPLVARILIGSIGTRRLTLYRESLMDRDAIRRSRRCDLVALAEMRRARKKAKQPKKGQPAKRRRAVERRAPRVRRSRTLTPWNRCSSASRKVGSAAEVGRSVNLLRTSPSHAAPSTSRS